ncbi:hypothetical protein BaRGS_00025451, partial [Batillaria attramentaria]
MSAAKLLMDGAVAFEDEVRRRRHELDNLQLGAASLTDRGAGPIVEPELKRLNQRWLDISSQLAQYKQPSQSSPSSSSPAKAGDNTSSSGGDNPDSTITRTTFNVVSTSISRTTTSSRSPGQFLQDVLKLLSQVGELQQRLRTPDLSADDFSLLDQQQAQLKAIDGEMVALQPSVEEVERQKDDVISQTSGDEAARLRDLTSQLHTQWTTLAAAYKDRQDLVMPQQKDISLERSADSAKHACYGLSEWCFWPSLCSFHSHNPLSWGNGSPVRRTQAEHDVRRQRLKNTRCRTTVVGDSMHTTLMWLSGCKSNVPRERRTVVRSGVDKH